MATQDGGDGRLDDRDTEFPHFTNDPLRTPGITSPIILKGKSNNLLFVIQACTFSTTSTLRLVMLFDQQSIPTTYRAKRGNDSDLEQMLPSNVVTESGQLTTVIVSQVPDCGGTMKTEKIPFQQDIRELPSGTFQMLRGNVSDIQRLRGHGTEAWGAGRTASGQSCSSYAHDSGALSIGRQTGKRRGIPGESLTFQSGTTQRYRGVACLSVRVSVSPTGILKG